MTRNQETALRFAVRNAGKWHGYASDRNTRNALNALANRCLVELSETTSQFRATGKGIALICKLDRQTGDGPESVKSLFRF